MIKKLFYWVFKNEIDELRLSIEKNNTAAQKCDKAALTYSIQAKRIKNVLANLDISVDVHHYSKSWACISIQGQKTDYIKFIDLGERDIRGISQFLHQFERNIKIDATPQESYFIKCSHNNFK